MSDIQNNQYCKLYVGNLSPKVTEYQLVKLFSQHGTIVQENFMWHRDGPKKGQPRGYAFIEFSTRGDAERAVAQLDGRSLFGRPLVVRFAEGGQGPKAVSRKSGAGAAERERQIAAIQRKLRSMEQEGASGG